MTPRARRHGAAVAADKFPDDGQAQSGAARIAAIVLSGRVSRPGVVQSGEPFEDAIPLGGGDARPVVGHRDHGPRDFGRGCHPHPGTGMAYRVIN